MDESNTSESTDAWQPNEELLEMLIGMGISKIAAEHVCSNKKKNDACVNV